MPLNFIALDFSHAFCPNGCCRAYVTHHTRRLLQSVWRNERIESGFGQGASGIGICGDSSCPEEYRLHGKIIGLGDDSKEKEMAETWGLILDEVDKIGSSPTGGSSRILRRNYWTCSLSVGN